MSKFIRLLGMIILSTMAAPVFAEDLMDIYRQALQSDPTFKQAIAQHLSSREALPQGIAVILPNLSLAANTMGNKTSTSAPLPEASGTDHFNTHGYTLTLTQPVVNFSYWLRALQAGAIVKQANATFGAAAQDLILRVANAYFAVLQSEDDLQFIRAEKKATAKQLDQAKQRYDVGLEAITTVYEAQASYDSTVAQEIAAENSLNTSHEELREITGQYYPQLAKLKQDLPLLKPQPHDSEQWVAAANKQNLTLQAARYGVDSARQNVKANYANHLPIINAIGTYEDAQGFSQNAGGTTDTETSTIGLQLSVPLFQGGLVTSQTRQARYNYQATAAGMDATYRNVVASTREQYNNVIAGISKIKADKQAVLSNQSSLESTNEAYRVGTRTIVDVLLAQENLLQARRVYAQDQYAYLISTLTLKQMAGTLNENDLKQINTWLSSGPAK